MAESCNSIESDVTCDDERSEPEATILSRCRSVGRTIGGTIIGFLRLFYSVCIIILLIAHVLSPPVTFGVNEAKLTGNAVDSLSYVWAYCRLSLEMVCSFIMLGDAMVTFTDLTGNTGGQVSFTSIFEVPTWTLRLILSLVVSSSVSCEAYEFICLTWSESLAQVYTGVPVALLSIASLLLLLGVVPLVKDSMWYITPWDANDGKNWTPNDQGKKKKQSKRLNGNPSTCEFLQICFILFIPIFCLSLNMMGIVKVATGEAPSCCPWRTILNYAIHILLNLTTGGYFILRFVRRVIKKTFFIAKWLLGYLIISVLADLNGHVTHLIPFAVVQAFGLILLFAIPVLVTPFTWVADIYFGTRKEWLVRFLKNFTQFNKWHRLFQVVFHGLAMTGVIMALLSIPLPWFHIKYQPDEILSSTMDVSKDFQKLSQEAISELSNVINEAEKHKSPSSCKDYVSSLESSMDICTLQGGGIREATEAIAELRKAKYYKDIGRNAAVYRSHLQHTKYLMNNITGVASMTEKLMVLEVSKDCFVLFIFLLPPLLTGCITAFFAFWPRRIEAENLQTKRKRATQVFMSCLSLLLLNLFGFLLFRLLAPIIISISDGVTMINATYSRGPGSTWVDRGFICAITSTLISTLQSVFLIIRSSRSKCFKNWGDSGDLAYDDEDMDLRYDVHDMAARRSEQTRSTRVIDMCTRRTPRPDSPIPREVLSIRRDPGQPDTLLMEELPVPSPSVQIHGVRPSGWVLYMIIMTIAAALSISSVQMAWITFMPTMNSKWSNLIGRQLEVLANINDFHSEFKNDLFSCDLFSVDMSSQLPRLLSMDFDNIKKSLHLKLQLPQFNLIHTKQDFTYSFTSMYSIIFILPILYCWVLATAGFVSSFRQKSRFYFSSKEVSLLTSRAIFYHAFSMSCYIFVINYLFSTHGPPLYKLFISMKNGLILGSLSHCLVMTASFLLHIESAVPGIDR